MFYFNPVGLSVKKSVFLKAFFVALIFKSGYPKAYHDIAVLKERDGNKWNLFRPPALGPDRLQVHFDLGTNRWKDGVNLQHH